MRVEGIVELFEDPLNGFRSSSIAYLVAADEGLYLLIIVPE